MPPTSSILSKHLGQSCQGREYPLAAEMFLASALCAIPGIAYLGVHLWLMISSQMVPWQNFSSMRFLHALIQVHIFLGIQILGFFMQSHARYFGGVRFALWLARGLVLALGLGVLLIWVTSQYAPIGSVIISLAYSVPLIAIFKMTLKERRWPSVSNSLFFLAFAGLVLSAWLNLQHPGEAIMAFWLGIGGAIFASAQHFIAGSLQGKRLSGRSGTIFICLMALSFMCLLLVTLKYSTWPLFGVVSFACVVFFVFATRLHLAAKKCLQDPFAVAFALSFFWAATASLQLLFDSPRALDFALHTWATGWAMTLILAVSLRIMSFLAFTDLLSKKLLYCLIIAWQLVPFSRTYGLYISNYFAWIGSSMAFLVLCVWTFLLIKAYRRIFLFSWKDYAPKGSLPA